MRSFKPDVTVAARTGLKVGGTRIELIPIQGGESSDGMFIYLPDQGVMFAGDFIMPYLGAPFVEEGNFQGRELCSARARHKPRFEGERPYRHCCPLYETFRRDRGITALLRPHLGPRFNDLGLN